MMSENGQTVFGKRIENIEMSIFGMSDFGHIIVTANDIRKWTDRFWTYDGKDTTNCITAIEIYLK